MLGKILYLIPVMSCTIHRHIVEYLSNNGYSVDPVVVTYTNHFDYDLYYNVVHGEKRITEGIIVDKLIDKCHSVGYDVVIIAGDTICSTTRRLQQKFSPRLGYIDVEHDLLGYGAAGSKKDKHLGAPAFHQRHYDSLVRRGYKAIKARWYKLDAIYPEHKFEDLRPMEDAVFVGSDWRPYVSRMKKSTPFEYNHLFRNVYYKRWHYRDVTIKAGTILAPEICDTPLGSKYCSQLSNFCFTLGSNTCIDMLLFGGIPILYNPDIKSQSKLDDIISTVNFPGHFDPAVGYAITCENLNYKIGILRSDPKRYLEVSNKLKEGYFPEDYMDWKPAHEVILQLIGEAHVI